MDVTKLMVKLPVDRFYDTYVKTIRDLYTASFIAQNHLEPSTQSSFQRAMSKRAGVSLDEREDTKQYTVDDLTAIVNDTNAKYEEYSQGDYSESTRTRGEARYRLMSTVLKETLTRLGYVDIAEKFKYAENSKNTAEENINEAYNAALAAEQEEDTAVKENIELLKNSLSVIKDKIAGFSEKTLSAQDKETLGKIKVALEDTVKSAKKCTEGKNNVDDLKELIKQGEQYAMKLQDMITNDSVQKLEQVTQTVTDTPIAKDTEISYNNIMQVLKVLPSFVEKLQETASQNTALLKQVQDLKTEMDSVKAQTSLPDDDEALVGIAKDIINKINDKNKLKDLVMVIALKTL